MMQIAMSFRVNEKIIKTIFRVIHGAFLLSVILGILCFADVIPNSSFSNGLFLMIFVLFPIDLLLVLVIIGFWIFEIVSLHPVEWLMILLAIPLYFILGYFTLILFSPPFTF